MKTVYNQRHAGHAATHEFFRGRLVPAFEIPARADYVLKAVQAAALGEVLAPVDHGLAPLERVHAPAYLRFLRGAYAEWLALGGGAMPSRPSGRCAACARMWSRRALPRAWACIPWTAARR